MWKTGLLTAHGHPYPPSQGREDGVCVCGGGGPRRAMYSLPGVGAARGSRVREGPQPDHLGIRGPGRRRPREEGLRKPEPGPGVKCVAES